MKPIAMAAIQSGAKVVDGLIDIGVNSLNEALWGDYYRDKEVEQSQKLLDQQTTAQSKLMQQSKDQQLTMWNATNYGAQTAHLRAAGLNPALMYGAGGGGGSTTAGSGAGGQATASGAGKQQLLMDRTTPVDVANIMVSSAQAKKLEAEAKNLDQDTKAKEQHTLKLAEEVAEVKANVARIEGETALQGWAQRQLMSISDSELKSYSEGEGWNKGWSEGTSQGTSKNESKQGGASVSVKVMGSGGGASGYGGWSKGDSQNTSESKSENAGANKSKSEATSTSGSRNVLVWPKYNKNGELEHIYMYILDGDYKNISTEFRRD